MSSSPLDLRITQTPALIISHVLSKAVASHRVPKLAGNSNAPSIAPVSWSAAARPARTSAPLWIRRPPLQPLAKKFAISNSQFSITNPSPLSPFFPLSSLCELGVLSVLCVTSSCLSNSCRARFFKPLTASLLHLPVKRLNFPSMTRAFATPPAQRSPTPPLAPACPESAAPGPMNFGFDVLQ